MLAAGGAWSAETAPAPFTIQTKPKEAAPAAKAAKLNPTGRAMRFVAPLNERENFLGEVEVQVDTDDSVQVSAGQVVDLLAKSIDPAALEPLRAAAAASPFIPIGAFGEHGFAMTFDRASLALQITLPTSARARQSIGLADLDRSAYGDFVKPARVSAYLNLRSSVDYVHQGSDRGFGDTLVLLDGATRLGGVVLESEGAWSSNDGLQRDGARLVYDDPPHFNRWTAGDLLPQGRGFQGIQDIAGISVERTYSLLDPQRNVTPRGGRSFTLDRESTVEASVNGRIVRTLRLQPGSYDVSDFPFVQGSNDVQLVISDDTGQREVLAFSIFVDRTQLAPGLSEYGFYAGVGSRRSGGSIDYSGDFAASGFYRRGVFENLTLGANGQYAGRSALAGIEGVWGSPFGALGADLAYSRLDGGLSGWAANLTYERLIQSEGGGTSLSASMEMRSRRFGAPGQLAPDNRYVFNSVVAFSRAFGDSSFAGGQIRYAKARGDFDDELSVRLTYGRRLGSNLSLVLDADWADGGSGDGLGFRIGLVRRFGAAGSARAEYDTRSETGQLSYQTSGGRGVGAWSVAGTLQGSGDDYGLNAAAAYAANRADLGIAHSTSYSLDAGAISDQRTSLRAAGGIAFADGAVAIGRPVSDGFAIVRPYRTAAKVAVEVEPAPEGYYARSGALGPALYGQIGAYTPRSVVYDAPDAPPGFDVGSGAVRIMAPYRAGYVVTVGSDYGVTAIGRLLDADGEPVVFLSGSAIEEGPGGRRVQVFTNRQGAFGASGLRAGKWRIELLGGLVYQLVVPETPEGIARIGDLRPVP